MRFITWKIKCIKRYVGLTGYVHNCTFLLQLRCKKYRALIKTHRADVTFIIYGQNSLTKLSIKSSLTVIALDDCAINVNIRITSINYTKKLPTVDVMEYCSHRIVAYFSEFSIKCLANDYSFILCKQLLYSFCYEWARNLYQ